MKTSAILVAAAFGLANAKPHANNHAHRHIHHKKDAAAVTVSSGSAVETAFAFVLNGETISQDDVCSGISSGELKWEGNIPEGACAAASSISVATTSATPTSTSSSSSASSASATSSAAAAEFFEQSSSSSVAASSSSAYSSSYVASSTSAAASASSSSESVTGLLGELIDDILEEITDFVESLAEDSYDDFPDGEISCSTFPSKYGAIPATYLNMNGWTGIQNLNSAGDDIDSDGTDCTDGAACSYTCAPGWQKLQWPETQPSDGASIGGLLCKNGLLYKSSSTYNQLCGKGNGLVYAKNQAGGAVSICRTDYPGNEAENVPLDVADGDTQPMTCPIEEDYYMHEGDYTSAQYYLNPIGVKATSGCSWDGDGSGDTGNSAPIVLGVGQLDGTTWLSIQQNTPTYYGAFEGTVEIQGDDISGSCKYSNGEYCSDSGCTSHSTNGAGCTVSTTGTAYYVITS